MSRFDRAGREIEQRDRNGNATTYAFDERGEAGSHRCRRRSLAAPALRRPGTTGRDCRRAGARCSYEYDASGRLATVTDSDGWRAAYRYLDNGRLSEIAYPDGRKVQFAYDDAAGLSSGSRARSPN
ncbi:MAG: hypothetical protein MZV49_05760 [Rhodopseudomonas palustris]|nr:hypothetical protein [Rhodopseudomonas palustris]